MCDTPTILVVDEDARSRAFVRRTLRDTYSVREAASGAEALEFLAHEAIDLLLLDAAMHDMSGPDLCREVKRRSQREVLPVLMVTAPGHQWDRNAGYEAGADRCLSRPIDTTELRLHVAALMRLRGQDKFLRKRRSLIALKDDLVSLVIHDLRNPLGGIQALLGLIRSTGLDPTLRGAVVAAQASAAKLGSILDDALKVRLLEEGKLGVEHDVHSVVEIVREAFASVGPEASERSVDLALTATGDPALPLDRKLVRRAVENLLATAVRRSPRREMVEVEVSAEGGGGVQITVAGRGSIDDLVGREVFEESWGGKAEPEGLARWCEGLGLYLVKLVAIAHGGRVVARKRERGGSILGFWLEARGPVRAHESEH